MFKNFESMFDKVVTRGYITKDVSISSDFIVKLKPLSEGERIMAEAMIPQEAKASISVYKRAETIYMAAYATIELNGVDVIKAAEDEKITEEDRVKFLAGQIKRLSSTQISKLAEEYNNLVLDQKKLYETVGEDVKNF